MYYSKPSPWQENEVSKWWIYIAIWWQFSPAEPVNSLSRPFQFRDTCINMISAFHLDPMNIVYLDVAKKLISLSIDFYHKRIINTNKSVVTDINKLISSCVENLPSEFQRKCRASDFFPVWKATKCSVFLLYSAFVTPKHYLPLPLYLNFKLLALAMYLLAHPTLHSRATDSVKNDLLYLHKEYEWWNGTEYLV